MYFGSVRFFKHLILGVVLVAIIAPTVTAAFLFVENSALRVKVNTYMFQNPQVSFTSTTLGKMRETPLYLPDYSSMYSHLYVPTKTVKSQGAQKTAYLTFDDGPSNVTDLVLDILKKYNIKATFFVVGNQLNSKENQNRLRRIAEEGHIIGIHTQSHDYGKMYASVEAYLTDFNKVWTKVKEITGIEAEVFRFPGGSLNGYNQNLQHELIAEMLRRGFRYYDWNVSSMDASVDGNYTVNEIIGYSVDVPKEDNPIILMHDSQPKVNTARALPMVIEKLLKKGFCFSAIDSSVEPVVFGYGK